MRARVVEPEWLDTMSVTDPLAIRARRDLRRINAWLRNPCHLARLIEPAVRNGGFQTVAEIGGGDGWVMLRAVERLAERPSGVFLELVDRLRLLAPETAAGFEAIGWKVRALQADVFEWLPRAASVDVLAANLFLHHFSDAELTALFGQLAAKAELVVVCEPRRLRFPRLATASLLLIGGNVVTRHDGLASIRAGFVGSELTALWPEKHGWALEEYEAGLATHCFRARRL
jgi:hypothetical protein